jgi:hypothetical protein
LTNLSIYWFTETSNSALRIYFESMHMAPATPTTKSPVPAAIAVFPKDLVPVPKDYADRIFNVQRFNKMPSGGHFAAMEEPEILAKDIRKFFSDLASTIKDQTLVMNNHS